MTMNTIYPAILLPKQHDSFNRVSLPEARKSRNLANFKINNILALVILPKQNYNLKLFMMIADDQYTLTWGHIVHRRSANSARNQTVNQEQFTSRKIMYPSTRLKISR